MPRAFLLSALVALLVVASSCTRVSRQRTLPPSIRTIAVPMFVNRTAEIGLEEDATRATELQFLADGRLDLVAPQRADAWISVTITDFETRTVARDADNFPRLIQYRIEADVSIIQNIPGKPVFGGPRRVAANATFNNDKRRVTFVPEPEGKRLVIENFARRIVQEVLTGAYTEGPVGGG